MTRPRPEQSGDWPEFWEGLRSGAVFVQGCATCGRQQFPPSVHCRRCAGADLRWEKPAPAVVYSYTTVYRPPEEAFAEEIPYVIAIAETSQGGRMLARLRDVEPENVRIGMPVHIVAVDHGEWQAAELRPAPGAAARKPNGE